MSTLKHCEECGKEFIPNLGKHKIKGNYWTKRIEFELDSWLTDHLTETQFKRGKNETT